MSPILRKIKPTTGFAYLFHLLILLILPIAVYVLVSLNFVQLALSIIVLSKWRMFAVKPRFWLANIRANSIDLIVGISIVVFLTHTEHTVYRLAWIILYAGWLLYIKPSTNLFWVTTQAFIGQFLGLTALYLAWASGPIYGLTLATGLLCYLAARHFLDAYDETYSKLLSYTWGYFGGALAWLLSHWLLFYGSVSLITLLLSVIGYGIAVLYYLDHFDKLNKGLKRQIITLMLVLTVVIIAHANWGAKLV